MSYIVVCVFLFSFASLAFMQHLLDQRYRKAMVELEKESMIKLQRAKDEMSRVLEAELVAKIMVSCNNLSKSLTAHIDSQKI